MDSTTQQTQPTTTEQTLNPTDLKNVLLLLDVAASRGAFKAGEMSQVGSIYDRVQTCLAAAAAE